MVDLFLLPASGLRWGSVCLLQLSVSKAQPGPASCRHQYHKHVWSPYQVPGCVAKALSREACPSIIILTLQVRKQRVKVLSKHSKTE